MAFQNCDTMCDCDVWTRVGKCVHNKPLYYWSVRACSSVYVCAIKAGPVPCTNTTLVLPLPCQLGLTDQYTQKQRSEKEKNTPNTVGNGGSDWGYMGMLMFSAVGSGA